ncbi:hypothetical protein [Castellaniella sp. MT123]|uniref:hypothetical protein n=1 Tax=Castellaniella sp. MT123 TaxID=3140381 RepID=UPI0031F4520E
MATIQDVLDTILRHLHTVHVDRSVVAAQVWLPEADEADVLQLLHSCPRADRLRVVTLLSDLLAGVPPLLAAPVIVFATPSQEGRPPAYRLPIPREDLSPPNSAMHFLGWAPPELIPCRQTLIDRTEAGQHIPWEQPTVTLALFAYAGSEILTPDEMPTCPAGWWGELFFPSLDTATISLSAGEPLLYPEAYDARNALADAIARRPPLERAHFFANGATIAQCQQRAALFQTC